MLFLAGYNLNHLYRMVAAGASSGADGLFPLTGLYDRKPNAIFKWTGVTDQTCTFDLNIVTNGTFETSTLSGWTDASVGASNAGSESAAGGVGGSKALLLTVTTTGGSNLAARYRDEVVRAGERLTISAAIDGDDTVTVRIRVQNLSTGKYLTSSGTWQASATDVLTRSADTYATVSKTFTVESWLACLTDSPTLRITAMIDGSAAGSGLVDNLVMYPSLDFVGIFGHNIDPRVAIELHSSTDNFSGSDTTEATLTNRQPSLYHKLTTPVDRRYFRLKLSGTNSAYPYIGELVLGQAKTMTPYPEYPITIESRFWQARNMGPTGAQFVNNATEKASRVVRLPFKLTSETERSEVMDELFDTSRGGAYPVVIVPDETRQEVIFGKPGGMLGLKRDRLNVWVAEYEVQEEPFPSTLAGTASATAGVEDMYVNRIITQDGTALAPAWTFNDDQNTGVYRIGADRLGITVGGVKVGEFDSTGLVGVSSAPVRLSTSTTPVGNVGAGEDDLITYNLPAGTLTTNGQSVLIIAYGTFANTAVNKTLRIKFGSTTVLQSLTAQYTSNPTWKAVVHVWRTAAGAQLAHGWLDVHAGSGAGAQTSTTPAETLSGAVTIKGTGDATNNDDIVMKVLEVWHIK